MMDSAKTKQCSLVNAFKIIDNLTIDLLKVKLQKV